MANLGFDPVSAQPVSALQSPLTLPFNNSQQVLSAPSTRSIGYASVAVNLLTTTLFAVAMFPPGKQAHASSPPPKYQVQCEEQPRNLAIGINPNPKVVQWSDSAPPPKYRVQLDQPLIQPKTLGITPNPTARQIDQSAPALKWTACVDVTPNLSITTLLAIQAPTIPFIPIDTAQWQGKYPVYSDIMTWGFDVSFSPPTAMGSEFIIRCRRRGRR